MEKVLFIDRDGTIVLEPEDEQIDSLSKIRFVPDAIGVLRRIRKEMNFKLVMITNQDGLGTPSFPEEDFYESHNFILDILDAEQEFFVALVNLVGSKRDQLVAKFAVLQAVGQFTANDLNLEAEIYDPEKNYKNVRNRWIGTSISRE